MAWLITGGAGYIGGHIVAAMREAAEEVVVLDDLSSGDLDRIPGVETVIGSVGDAGLVTRVLCDHDVQGIVHVAAKEQVEESVRLPLYYYRETWTGCSSSWRPRSRPTFPRSCCSPPAPPSTG